MTARSSTASRHLACLLIVLLVGAGTAGVATATTPVDDSTTLETDTDSLEETVNETSGELEGAVDETTDTVEYTTNTTDGLENTTNDTADTLGETTDGTTETVENTTDATAGGLESDLGTSVVIGGPGVGLEASAGVSMSERRDRADNAETGAADGAEGGMPPSGTSPATDAVLVGLLGAITASGAAAAGAGAGAGASAGAGAAAGAGTSAGSAGAASGVAGLSGLAANWLSQSSGCRYLRRIGSLLPWELVPIFKYSRYDESDPLENDCRRAVYETIAADPGCYLSQVSDDSSVALSTVRHHVRVLEEEGLVATAKVNGKRRYYLEPDSEGAVGARDGTANVELHAALAEPAKREVLETLADLESVPNGRLADELERDPSTVSHHLRALADDGLVARKRAGRSMMNTLTPEVETALDEERAAEGDSSRSSTAPADD